MTLAHSRSLRWGWLLVSLTFLFLRFQNITGVFTQSGVILNDTDPYYRLHRIESILKGRALQLRDEKLSFPKGVDVPWPLGLDLLIAAPLKLYGSLSRIEIESFAAISIPFLSLPLLWGSGVTGTLLMGPWFGLFVGLLICFSLTLTYQTGLGRVDHHFLEAMMPLLFLMFWVKHRRFGRRYDQTWMVLILGLAPSFAPQGWIIGPMFWVGSVLDQTSKKDTTAKLLWFAFVVSLIPLAFSKRFLAGSFQWVSFSWWAPWLYLTLSALAQGFDTIQSKQLDRKWIGLIGVSVVAVYAFLFFKNDPTIITRNMNSAFQAVAANQGTMATTTEASSILTRSFSFWKYSDAHILLVGLACFIYFLFRRTHLFFLGYSLIPLVLSFTQIRFIPLALPMLLILVMMFFHSLISKIPGSSSKQILIGALVTCLIIVPFRPKLGLTFEGNNHRYFAPVRQFAFFLNDQFKRLAVQKQNQAILAHWDYGHWLLYYTGLPVIADPFQGPSAYEVIELFTSKGTDSLDSFIQSHPAKFLVIESGALRSFQWIESVGKDKDLYFRKFQEAPGKEYYETTEAFDELFMFRFFFELGRNLQDDHPEKWRLIFVSPMQSPLDQDIPALKAFENVEGVEIEGQSKRILSPLWITAKIIERGETTFFKQKAQRNKDRWMWRVPYGVYNRGGVTFDGKYYVHDEKGNTLATVGPIVEEQVLRGDRIDVTLDR